MQINSRSAKLDHVIFFLFKKYRNIYNLKKNPRLMREEEIKSLFEQNAKLEEFLRESPDEKRRIKGRALIHTCCNERMIKIERYKITNGSAGKPHEIKLRGNLYYCLKCDDWYEV